MKRRTLSLVLVAMAFFAAFPNKSSAAGPVRFSLAAAMKRCTNPSRKFAFVATNYGAGGTTPLSPVAGATCEFALPVNAGNLDNEPAVAQEPLPLSHQYIYFSDDWWNILEIVWTAPANGSITISSKFADLAGDNHVGFFLGGVYFGGGGTFGSTTTNPAVYNFGTMAVTKGEQMILNFNVEGCCTGNGLASMDIYFTRTK